MRYVSNKLTTCAGIIILFALPGCRAVRVVGAAFSIPPQVYQLSEVSYPPLPPDTPVLLTTGDIDEPYEEIAIISVSDQGRDVLERLSESLQEQARALGAGAVIRIDYDMEYGSPGTDLVQSATGTAVRRRSR